MRRGCATVTAAEAMLEAGASILQFRHKGHFSKSALDEAEIVARLCRGAGALFVMNDRADMAMLLDAGLHVGQDDLPPADARRLIRPDRPLGFSTHNAAQLRAGDAEPVDYLALGPVFGTASKENPDPVVGVELFAACRSLTAKPLVAIGGITRRNVAAVFRAGADSVAIIGDLLPEVCDKQRIRERAEEWLKTARR